MTYDNTNRGTLGKNKYFEKGSNQPEYTGKGNFNGVDFELAAWVKANKETGEKFFSISFKEPYVKASAVESIGTEEIPF